MSTFTKPLQWFRVWANDKKGKVIDCVQTGYQLNDKVIRHAKVAVGQ